MSSSSVENAALNSLRANYTPYKKEDKSGGNKLGSEAFLTLLVAQLENQNPMDPADTDQFTDQLSQFSQLEQLINLNDKIDAMFDQATGLKGNNNILSYVGMQVTGTANAMTIEDGSVSSGFYNLTKEADVTIVIKDDKGNVVKTLNQGQQSPGSFLIAWDGTDKNGEALDEGTYTYTVLADAGHGYKQVPSTLTGTVDAVVYQNGVPYLMVGGMLLDPSSVTAATRPPEATDTPISIMEYLGKTVSSNYPIVRVDQGQVTGEDLSFKLDVASDVTVTIYNAADKAVATINVPAKDTVAGDNQVNWDGMAGKFPADDGLYYYTVTTADGTAATTPVTGEVTRIVNIKGGQYLELGESGRLVSLSSIISIQ